MFNWIKGLFKKKEPEKIRVTIRGGKFVKATIPSDCEYYPSAIRQTILCYEIKLNGNPYLQGLGGGSLVMGNKVAI